MIYLIALFFKQVMKNDDFAMSKKTFVHQSSIAPKWIKDTWQEAKDVREITVQIGINIYLCICILCVYFLRIYLFQYFSVD